MTLSSARSASHERRSFARRLAPRGNGNAVDLRGQARRHPGGQLGARGAVPQREHLTLLVGPGHQVTADVRHHGADLAIPLRERGLDRLRQHVQALAGPRRHDQAARLLPPQRVHHDRVGRVGLVDHDQLRHITRADLGQDLTDGGDLGLRIRVAAVHHVQDQVGLGDLLQGGAGTPRPAGAGGGGRTRPCRSA